MEEAIVVFGLNENKVVNYSAGTTYVSEIQKNATRERQRQGR